MRQLWGWLWPPPFFRAFSEVPREELGSCIYMQDPSKRYFQIGESACSFCLCGGGHQSDLKRKKEVAEATSFPCLLVNEHGLTETRRPPLHKLTCWSCSDSMRFAMNGFVKWLVCKSLLLSLGTGCISIGHPIDEVFMSGYRIVMPLQMQDCIKTWKPTTQPDTYHKMALIWNSQGPSKIPIINCFRESDLVSGTFANLRIASS